MISVGAVNEAGEYASFSNEGPELEFVAPGHYEPLTYSPVPCAPGTFRVDKLPTVFTVVHAIHGSASQTVPIDPTTGEAAFETGAPRG